MNRNSHDAWKATLTIGLLIVGIGAVGLVIGYDRMANDRNPGTGVIDEEESNVDLRTDRAFAAYIYDACEAFEVNKSITSAIIEAESGWNPQAVNPVTNASGLMQIVPTAWNQMVDALIDSCDLASKPDSFDPLEPYDNVLVGIYTLDWLTQYYDGDLPSALLAYAWGYNAADKAIAEGYEPTDCEWVAKILKAADVDDAQHHYEERERVEK